MAPVASLGFGAGTTVTGTSGRFMRCSKTRRLAMTKSVTPSMKMPRVWPWPSSFEGMS